MSEGRVYLRDFKMPEGCGKCPMFEPGKRHWREGSYKNTEPPTGYCWAGRFVLYFCTMGHGYDDGDCPLEIERKNFFDNDIDFWMADFPNRAKNAIKRSWWGIKTVRDLLENMDELYKMRDIGAKTLPQIYKEVDKQLVSSYRAGLWSVHDLSEKCLSSKFLKEILQREHIWR